nr:MAG: GNAT family N-acetyltransferase [Pseudomonadota bacterium]
MALNALSQLESAPRIEPAEPRETQRILSALTLAFAADPAVRWMFPDPEQHLRFFPEFARAFGGAALGRHTAWVAGEGIGAALWLAPDTHPDEAALAAVVEQGVVPRQRDEVFAVFEEMGKRHPAQPHWYLPLIGVEPTWQGRGLGSALLRPILALCDATGRLAYLESTNPKNRPLYERHGFEAIGEIRVGSCPPIVPMLRRPRSIA